MIQTLEYNLSLYDIIHEDIVCDSEFIIKYMPTIAELMNEIFQYRYIKIRPYIQSWVIEVIMK